MNMYPVYSPYNIDLVKGEGLYVYGADGQAYMDFYGGHAVISIGHGHPHFIDRVQKQLHLLPFYSNSILMPLQEELTEKLGRITGMPDYQLFLVNSGAEANENALKLASFETGKSKVIAFERSFHGRTSAAVNVTDNESIKAPINRGFDAAFLPWGDLDQVEKHLSNGDVCAVIVEGIQGVGGIHVAGVDFLKGLRQLCDKYGSFLILDEIQSGFGRSGQFFEFQFAAILPDVVTMAKGMGNGFPVGGILIHPRIKGTAGQLGTTFGGNHLACAACLAVIEVLEQEQLIENAATVGHYLMTQLKSVDTVKEVRGLGLMIGLEMQGPVKQLRHHLLFDQKVFTGNASHPNVIRLLPPLTIDRKVADDFIGRFIYTIQEIQ